MAVLESSPCSKWKKNEENKFQRIFDTCANSKKRHRKKTRLLFIAAWAKREGLMSNKLLLEIISVCGYLITLGLVLTALKRKREPVSALAWSLAIIFLPFIGAIAFISVSYTRLRAHETVLDLVCRLLLEKKKIKQVHFPIHPKNITRFIFYNINPTPTDIHILCSLCTPY